MGKGNEREVENTKEEIIEKIRFRAVVDPFILWGGETSLPVRRGRIIQR